MAVPAAPRSCSPACSSLAKARNGATAWFSVGGFQIQPSEFAKVTLILMLASYLRRRGAGRGLAVQPRSSPRSSSLRARGPHPPAARPRHGLGDDRDRHGRPARGRRPGQAHRGDHRRWPCSPWPCSWARASSTGTSRTGCSASSGTTRAPATATAPVSERDRQLRESSRQVDNSQAAISKGRLTGDGFLDGSMTNGGYVPEQHTDFVFSAIGEQFGLVGTMLVLLLYGLLGLRMWRIAQLAGDLTGALIAAGALTHARLARLPEHRHERWGSCR